MVTQHYRWDFIGLSTDEKPTPATSEKVVDGSTFYCSDNSKLYVFYNDTWYERKALGGGGGGGSYTAGTGIDITDDTISVDTITIQEKLTAGTGIDITSNTISVDTTVIEVVGETESYTIATSDWSSLSSSDPYTYQATVTATHTIVNSTVAELLNDSAVTFATYGFAIGSISGQSVTIYSIGQPSSSVTLKINYKG